MSYNLDGSAISEIKELVLESSVIVQSDARDGERYLVRNPSGEVKLFEIPYSNLNNTALDLRSLKTMLDRDGDVVQDVFVSDDRIEAVVEDGHYRTINKLALPLHPAFQHMLNWQAPTKLDQKALVRLLRTELRDNVEPTVIQTFSRLKFTNNEESTSEVRPQSAALDISIRQRVATDAGQDAPETIHFKVPVFDIAESRNIFYDIEVYVEYSHEAKAFILLAVHSHLREARESAVAHLISTLSEHADNRWPVLYGQPR